MANAKEESLCKSCEKTCRMGKGVAVLVCPDYREKQENVLKTGYK